MSNISFLIEQIVKGGDNAEPVVKELAGLGQAVLPDIIEKMKGCDHETFINFKKVLFMIEPDASMPFMIDLLNNMDISDSDNGRIYITALQVLGGKEKANEILVKELLNTESIYRMFAANVLGETGNQNAVKYLKQVAQDIINKEEYYYETELFIESVIAMAKLDDHSMDSHILEIAQQKDPVKRVQAVKELKYLAVPKLYDVLKNLIYDEIDEIRMDAMDALFYLGLKESVSEFIKLTKDNNTEIAYKSFYIIYSLTGELFDYDIYLDESIEDVQKWWQKDNDKYKSGVCLRLGKPVFLPDIIKLLDKKPEWKYPIIEELFVITGYKFGLNPFIHLAYQDLSQVYTNAVKWWRINKDRFRPGILYKHGFEQKI